MPTHNDMVWRWKLLKDTQTNKTKKHLKYIPHLVFSCFYSTLSMNGIKLLHIVKTAARNGGVYRL